MLADPTGPGPCSLILTGVSILLILLTLPLSLTLCIKVKILVKNSQSLRSLIFFCSYFHSCCFHKLQFIIQYLPLFKLLQLLWSVPCFSSFKNVFIEFGFPSHCFGWCCWYCYCYCCCFHVDADLFQFSIPSGGLFSLVEMGSLF